MQTSNLDKIYSWKQIVTIEPQIQYILDAAIRIKDDGGKESFCANRYFYEPGGFKDQLSYFVGWSAENPQLKSENAYDIVYKMIYEALPDCRNCSCM